MCYFSTEEVAQSSATCEHEDLSSIPGTHVKCDNIHLFPALGMRSGEEPWGSRGSPPAG